MALLAEAEDGGGNGALLAETALARPASVFVTTVEVSRLGRRGIDFSSRSGMARLRIVEFQRFLMALSVRPGSRCGRKAWQSCAKSDCAMQRKSCVA